MSNHEGEPQSGRGWLRIGIPNESPEDQIDGRLFSGGDCS